MLKVITFIATVFVAAQATATPYMQISEQQLAMDKAFCSVQSEFYARGKLQDQDIKVHEARGEAFPMSDDIYGVVVSTMIYVDVGLIGKGPQIAYSCYRCPNLKLVVSENKMQDACKDEQK